MTPTLRQLRDSFSVIMTSEAEGDGKPVFEHTFTLDGKMHKAVADHDMTDEQLFRFLLANGNILPVGASRGRG